MTLTVATQILEDYAKPTQELKEEDNTVKFTIMVMTTIFLLGFMFGCWCACRCCRTVHAASPAAETTTTRARAKREARPAPTAAAAAAEVDEPVFEPDLQEPLLQTAPPTRTRTTPTPTPPTRFPQHLGDTAWSTVPCGQGLHGLEQRDVSIAKVCLLHVHCRGRWRWTATTSTMT